jgi:hypothetical protein
MERHRTGYSDTGTGDVIGIIGDAVEETLKGLGRPDKRLVWCSC